jgi:hypothetical protein
MLDSVAVDEEVRSGTCGAEVTIVPESDVGGLDDDPTVSPSNRGKPRNSGLSGATPAPAAAIICGLRGDDEELARLPFLEC